MAPITHSLLVQYQAALQQTLTSYSSEEHAAIDKLRMSITLQFVIEYNQRLLNVLHKLAFIPGSSGLTDRLLCVSTGDEYETLQHDTDNMLIYYQKISNHMVDELNPRVEKISNHMLITLFATASIRSLSYLMNTEKLDPLAVLTLLWFFVLLGLRTSIDHSVSQFMSFSRNETFAPANKLTQKPINVSEIKQWFETTQIFFSKSLADTVKDTMTEPSALPYMSQVNTK